MNESTSELSDKISFTESIKIIPILNPDGAEHYTRVNAHAIDLNRDAVDINAKESQLLRTVLEEFCPDFCFNLHDQRTIFGVEGTKNPATISFLAPSEEETRKVTPTRKKTMNVIVAMNSLLQQIIPNHIGRYTDTFYPKATGDNFQKLGYSTILIESGHYKKDYQREKVREFTFISILQGLYHISIAKNYDDYNAYFKIPNNNESFSENFTSKNFNFDETQFNPKLSYLFNDNTRFDIFYQFTNKENTIGDLETLEQQKYGASFAFSNKQKMALTGEFNYFSNDFSGNANTPVAYQMLEGLQPGKNYTWTLLAQKKLTKYLDLNLSYFGRKTETSKTIHTGTIQLKAYF